MRRLILLGTAALLTACPTEPQDGPGGDETITTVSGAVISSWEDGEIVLAGATVYELGNPSNSDVTDENGLWVLEVTGDRFVGATVQAEGFLDYTHIVDLEFASSTTPELRLQPFSEPTLDELYEGDYGYTRQTGTATLVVMIEDGDGADYTGAAVSVTAEYEESLVEAPNMDLVPGSVSGQPWAEVLFVNVEAGATQVNVDGVGGDACLEGLDVMLDADSYVYVDTGCTD